MRVGVCVCVCVFRWVGGLLVEAAWAQLHLARPHMEAVKESMAHLPPNTSDDELGG